MLGVFARVIGVAQEQALIRRSKYMSFI